MMNGFRKDSEGKGLRAPGAGLDLGNLLRASVSALKRKSSVREISLSLL